jgi:hypothetical protein
VGGSGAVAAVGAGMVDGPTAEESLREARSAGRATVSMSTLREGVKCGRDGGKDARFGHRPLTEERRGEDPRLWTVLGLTRRESAKGLDGTSCQYGKSYNKIG